MGLLGPIFTFFFGRHIVEPPLEDIIDQGYSFVAMHPPDYLPDHASKATDQLNEILGNSPDRPGALTIWASLSTALADELKGESPARPIIAFGHSRYGKIALLAAANSNAIDGVIAHQSGTAGASLMRDEIGESLAQLVKTYPHWLKPAADQYANDPRTLPTDSHALLAKLASKPVLCVVKEDWTAFLEFLDAHFK